MSRRGPDRKLERPSVVLGGTAHWSIGRLAEHHLASGLADHVDVLFVDPPVSPVTVARRRELLPLIRRGRLREVAPGVWVLIPVVLPGKDRRGILRPTDHLVRNQISGAVRRLRLQPTATILTLPQRLLFDKRSPSRRIYWAKDDHVAGAGLYGLDPDQLAAAESRVAHAADDLVVCSPSLANAWRRTGLSPVVMPNGCDTALFARAEELPLPSDLPVKPGYALYAGTLASRIDAELLLAVADSGVEVVLLGAPRRTSSWNELAELSAHPRVHQVGARPYELLPAYLANAGVGLVPYRDDDYNRHSFPLKILEYLAAGLPVVATDLPAARWLGTKHVRCAPTLSDFVRQVQQVRVHPHLDVDVAARRAVAAEHDWSRRVEQVLELVGLHDPRD